MRHFCKSLLLSVLTSALSTSAWAIDNTTLFTAQDGWVIYEAGTYRYAPSMIINDDGSIDAWFACVGANYGDTDARKNLYLPTDANAQTPLNISQAGTVAQYFEAPESFHAFGVCCPTWGTKEGEYLTISIYAYAGTYEATLATTPIYSKTYTNLADNGWVYAYCSTEAETDESLNFAAGEYLCVLSDASSSAGVWLRNTTGNYIAAENLALYQGGSLATGVMQARLYTCDPTQLVEIFWDQISYQHSTDNGKTWSTEVMALQPTDGSRDQLSCCDPGVARWGGYYYIGYTSTENSAGVDNDIYVARSTSPTGPWEKWNGSGWGGNDPQPVIEFTGTSTNWGCGEPSMVVVDSTLYFYYTWNNGRAVTRLATASATDENWPASLAYKSLAINRSSLGVSDQVDVKYCDELGKFIAIHTVNCRESDSYILVWQSDDGTRFTKLGKLDGPLQAGLHNCGISGDARGHISTTASNFVGYSYGIDSWGKWNTYLHPIKFADDLTAISPLSAENRAGETPIYNLQGIRLSQPTRGIYIRNGRKFVGK